MADTPGIDDVAAESGNSETSFSQDVPPPDDEPADPLLNLIDRVKADGRVVFETLVLEALCQMEDTEPGEYTRLHWQMLEAGVVPELLRKAMQKVRAAAKKRQKETEAVVRLSVVQQLIALGRTGTFLFHTPDGVPFVDYQTGDHTVTGVIADHGAGSYGGWLRGTFYRASKEAPSPEALTAALNTLATIALFDGPEIAVYARIGWHEDKIYIDQGTPDWSVIEVDRDGWRIIEQAPIRFIRSAGIEPLPVPVSGGSISQFRELYTNIATDDDLAMIVGWILASFNPDGGLPILGVFGPYGSAKTTLLRGCRRLIDPNKLDTRTLPTSERDLMVLAQASWVQSFDNISHLSVEMSDVFCRLSTGASFGARKLFSDTGEVLLTARRPAAFTGIVEVIGRPDLVDRTFFVSTAAIPEEERLTEKVFWKRFDAVWPKLFGTVLDAVSRALRHRDDDIPRNLPRMADAAVWVSAGEEALGWKRGTFLEAHRRNTQLGARTAVESDLIGAAIVAFMSTPEVPEDGQPAPVADRRETWKGTATHLLALLRIAAGEGATRSQGWPKTPERLGRMLRPLIPALGKIGVILSISPTHTPQRLLTLCWADSNPTTASTPGQKPTAPPPDTGDTPSTEDCARVRL
jgi:hypothetical protein